MFWLKKEEFRPDGAVQKKEVVNNLKEIILELVDEITSRSLTKEGDTQFKFIENCTHGNMLEVKDSSAQIAGFIKEFIG